MGFLVKELFCDIVHGYVDQIRCILYSGITGVISVVDSNLRKSTSKSDVKKCGNLVIEYGSSALDCSY